MSTPSMLNAVAGRERAAKRHRGLSQPWRLHLCAGLTGSRGPATVRTTRCNCSISPIVDQPAVKAMHDPVPEFLAGPLATTEGPHEVMALSAFKVTPAMGTTFDKTGSPETSAST
jgi:hypothetical protein